MVFEGITGVYERIYHLSSKWLSRERKICKFEMDFKKSFLLLFYDIMVDDIIS